MSGMRVLLRNLEGVASFFVEIILIPQKMKRLNFQKRESVATVKEKPSVKFKKSWTRLGEGRYSEEVRVIGCLNLFRHSHHSGDSMNIPKQPWNTKRYVQKSGGYEFLFGGKKIHKIQFGVGEVKLSFWDDFHTKISFGMKFDFVQHNQTQEFEASDVPSLAPLLQLVGSEIESVFADDSGFLHLHFDNKIQIQAPSNAEEFRFEAWEITDGHGFSVVCAVGGTTTIWDPHSAKLFDF